MDLTVIMQVISTVGFPIAMCCILMYYINTTQKELIKQLADISKSIAVLCDKVERTEENV